MARRPPPLSTRQASATACARAAFEEMLWIARLDTTTSKVPSGNGSARMSPVSMSMRSPTLSSDAFRGHVPGIPGLIVRAPQIDAGDAPRPQPRRDDGQDGAAPAAPVEHALVATQVKVVEDFFPHLELAAPGRVEKGGRVGEEERPVECQGRRHVAALPPRHDRGRHADRAERGKGQQRIGRAIAVVAMSLHRDDILVGMAGKDSPA
jgi:hypothetical protein